jgi:hypothetical protein
MPSDNAIPFLLQGAISTIIPVPAPSIPHPEPRHPGFTGRGRHKAKRCDKINFSQMQFVRVVLPFEGYVRLVKKASAVGSKCGNSDLHHTE